MSKREIASLAIKLMGVFLIVTSIGYLSMFFGFMNVSGLWQGVLMCIGCIASPACGILIIVYSDKIAAKLIREDNVYVPSGEDVMTKNDVMAIAFACIGLYIAVTAVPQLFSVLIRFIRFTVLEGQLFSGGVRSARSITTLIAPVVKLGLGVWLFVGSRGFVRLWHRVRG
ncbi:MAG: hypothetical protein FVQ79_12505 [Planctomycetes bacterium]|nr:hypothetical protein [Planctomycetota bacterium]